jgi:hypothetical protein
VGAQTWQNLQPFDAGTASDAHTVGDDTCYLATAAALRKPGGISSRDQRTLDAAALKHDR